jgi:glycopeptide antibiotics resistance protein
VTFAKPEQADGWIVEGVSPATASLPPAPATPQRHGQSTRRLAWGVLAYVLCVASVAVLIPFQLRFPAAIRLNYQVLPVDVAQNLVLLFPAGFLYRLTRRTDTDPRCLHALALGVGVSFLLEAAQILVAGRNPSPVDVVVNGGGAWLGAYVQRRMGRRLASTAPWALGLELPLLAVLFMLVPLLLVNSLVQIHPQRWWVTLPLAPFAALIAGSLFRHRLAQLSQLSALRYSLIVGAGFALGVLPGLLMAPWWGTLCAGTSGALTWLLIRAGADAHDRRFEADTVRRALPCFGIYLAALSTFPWNHLPFVQGLDLSKEWTTRYLVLTHVEGLTALTLLGYMLSELQARATVSDAQSVMRAALYATPVCLLFELARSSDLALGARGGSALLLVLAAAAGAAIHRGQLHVARELRRSAESAQAASAPKTE